jgi:hypothetical protein
LTKNFSFKPTIFRSEYAQKEVKPNVKQVRNAREKTLEEWENRK